MAPHTVLLWSLLASLEWCQASATTAVATKGPLTAAALFPAFDAQPISMGSAGWDMIRREARETGEADGQQMIQDLQTLANSARKAEGRMAKAYAAREQTKGPMGERPDYC